LSDLDRPPRAPTLRQDIAAEAAHYHVLEQAKRFGRIFAIALGVQLLSNHGHINGWVGLWSLLGGCAETAFRQWRKTMPVPAAQRVADDHEPLPPPWTPMP